MREMLKRVTISALLAAVPGGLPVLQRLILLPVYLQSNDQWALSLINRTSSALLVPGKAIMYHIAPPTGHYFQTGPLIAASVINFVIWSCAFFALLTRLGSPRLSRRQQKNPDAANEQASANESPGPALPPTKNDLIDRRDFLRKSFGAGAGIIIVGASAYPVVLRPGWLTVRHVDVPIKDLPSSLTGLTIAQFTDLHHDEWISIEHVRAAVELTNSLKPDIVALTGDYVTARGALIKPAIEALARLSPRRGVVAVMGNHDWWADPIVTRRQFKAFGIPLIDNARMFIGPGGKLQTHAADAALCLAGVGDLWESVVDPERALAGVPATMPRILLSHNPDVAEQGSIGHGHVRVDLQISGHTHGGQVRLPIIGAPVIPSAYGQKYAQGLIQGPSCPVHVSAGIGMAGLPIRLGVPPEIVLIRLISAQSHKAV